MKHGQNAVILDERGKPVYGYDWSPLPCEKLITFDGNTTDAWGENGGALDGAAVFTVTGTVRARVLGIVEVDLVGAATLELGVTGKTAGIIAQVANTTTMDAGQIWHDATVDSPIEVSTVAPEQLIANGLDMILTVGSADITAGRIRFLCSWYSSSQNGLVVPSNN